METTTETQNVNNGIDADAMRTTREALAQMPAAAEFTWRASCEWKGGVHCSSTLHGFFGLGEEKSHKQPFCVDADQPAEFAALDAAPTPVELVLSALASCLAGGVATVAQDRGIQLHSIRATVEGDMSLQGLLGIDTDVRNGFHEIRLTFDIDGEATKHEIAALVAQSKKRSAVFDIVANPSTVQVSIE